MANYPFERQIARPNPVGNAYAMDLGMTEGNLLGLDDRFVKFSGQNVGFLVHFPDTGEGETLNTATQRTQVRRELINELIYLFINAKLAIFICGKQYIISMNG